MSDRDDHRGGAGSALHRLRLFFRTPGGNMLSYFLLLTGALAVASFLVPWFRTVLVPPPAEMAGTGAANGFDAIGQAAERAATQNELFQHSISQTLILGATALIGALVFAAPIVRIYTVIMRQEGYDRSFVRMLASLPVVVAAVVQIVRGDLALAFALAGIVAAVRFRTTVKDLQNAVFAFAAIGIGLATGTGSFSLAALLSAVFSLLAYVMWKMNVGDVEPSLALSHGGLYLSEALVPGVTQKPVIVGDRASVDRLDHEQVSALEEAIDRLADYVRADALRQKGKYNTLMLVYTEKPEQAEGLVEEVLDEHADRWVHVDSIDYEGGDLSVLEYLLRLKKKVDVGTMIHSLKAGEGCIVLAVEMKPMKGLRKRLT